MPSTLTVSSVAIAPGRHACLGTMAVPMPLQGCTGFSPTHLPVASVCAASQRVAVARGGTVATWNAATGEPSEHDALHVLRFCGAAQFTVSVTNAPVTALARVGHHHDVLYVGTGAGLCYADIAQDEADIAIVQCMEDVVSDLWPFAPADRLDAFSYHKMCSARRQAETAAVDQAVVQRLRARKLPNLSNAVTAICKSDHATGEPSPAVLTQSEVLLFNNGEHRLMRLQLAHPLSASLSASGRAITMDGELRVTCVKANSRSEMPDIQTIFLDAAKHAWHQTEAPCSEAMLAATVVPNTWLAHAFTNTLYVITAF